MDGYFDVEVTDKDVEHMKNGTLPTYDKDAAEKTIREIEEALKQNGKGSMSEAWKERIRKSYRYVGN